MPRSLSAGAVQIAATHAATTLASSGFFHPCETQPVAHIARRPLSQLAIFAMSRCSSYQQRAQCLCPKCDSNGIPSHAAAEVGAPSPIRRSEEHTSELQSPMYL